MKKLILILLLISDLSFANDKSRYAELNIKNEITDLTISPTEELYIFTGNDEFFKTKSFNSFWEKNKTSFYNSDKNEENKLCNIHFFNKDTAIITGRINDLSTSRKSILYLTTDGGINWKKIFINENFWIYDVFVNKSGEAWLCGSSGNIYYSNNYGRNWVKKNTPFNRQLKINNFFMFKNTGIAGTFENSIFVTLDNWETYKKIETPLDQNHTLKRNNFFKNENIEKVIFWDKYIVVSQNYNVFYTDTSTINWKRFETDLKDFAYDEDNNILYGITVDSKVLKINSINEYKYLTNIQNNKYIIESKAQNKSIYILNNNKQLYKIKDTLVEIDYLLTKDYKIPTPHRIKYGKNLIFGINGNNIYLADDVLLDWYRIDILDKKFADINIINDSTLILWDGDESNYIYSLKDKSIENYYYIKPIDKFLQNSIKECNMNSGSFCGFGEGHSDIKYDNLYNSLNNSDSENILNSKDNTLKLSVEKVTKILNLINENPYKLPTKSEFQFNNYDFEQYHFLLDTINLNENSINTKYFKNIKFYRNFKNIFDTLSEKNFKDIIQKETSFLYDGVKYFQFNFINSKNDTLLVELNCYDYFPMLLPMRITYKDIHFLSYNSELLNYIKDYIPDNFSEKVKLQNRFILLHLADLIYNYRKEE